MHFRKLTATVLKEFVAYTLDRNTNEIMAEDILWYKNRIQLAQERGGLKDTVICIFQLLFRNKPKSEQVLDLVGGWIRRGTPLINVLYGGRTCQNKKHQFTENDFDKYNIMCSDWKTRSHGSLFQPHVTTLEEIHNILKEYNDPIYPVTSAIP